MTPDRQELRRVFGLFATGVTVVTARNDQGEPIGVTANSLASVSLEPPLLLWCLDNRSRHLSAFPPGACFAVHILCEHQADIALRFARSGAAKFSGEDDPLDPKAPPVLGGVLARLECRVQDLHLAGDHTIIVGAVVAVSAADSPPLVFQKSRFGGFACQQPLNRDDEWRSLIDMWS